MTRKVAAFTGNGTKVVSLYIHPLTSAQVNLALYDNTTATFRHEVSVTWPSGVPTLTHISGSGRLFTVEAAAHGWTRVAFTADGILAANSNGVTIYPSPAGSNGDTVAIWRVQAEDRLTPYRAIQTTSATVWAA